MTLYFTQWILITVLLFLVHPCPIHSSTTLRYQEKQVTASVGVPLCAFGCIEAFAKSDYPSGSCPGLSDLDCLCRTNTGSGFTFGEAAHRCAISYCPEDVVSKSNVYTICDSVVGAQPMTHSIITATVFSVTSSATQETTTGVSSTSSTSTTSQITDDLTSTSGDGYVSNSNTRSSYRSSTTTQATTTAASPATIAVASSQSMSQANVSVTSPASTPATSHSLNSGAVIGISIASGISACFLAGVAIFFGCRKRRRDQKLKNQNFFEIGGFMSEPPNFSSPPGHESSAGGCDKSQGGFTPTAHSVIITRPIMDRLGEMNGSAPRGSPISSDLKASAAPMGMSSQQAPAQLFANRPIDELLPDPLRVNHHEDLRRTSEETLFEEDILPQDRSIPVASHGSAVGLSKNVDNDGGSEPNGLPTNPGSMDCKWEPTQTQTPAMWSSDQGATPSHMSSNMEGRVHPTQPQSG